MLFEIPGGPKIDTDKIESFVQDGPTILVQMISGQQLVVTQLIGATLMSVVRNSNTSDTRMAY